MPAIILIGPGCCERTLQGWRLIPILITVVLAIIAVSFVAAQVINERVAEWQVRLPPIPTAFTGREKEIQLVLDFVYT